MIHVAGGVITNHEHKVIIVSQKNSWSLPKGHVEEGETIFDAATREIVEETGIPKESLTFIRSLGSYVRNKISKDGINEIPDSPREIHWFLFSTDDEGRLTPLDEDNPEARWVTYQEALAMLTHPRDRKFLEEHRKVFE